MLRTILLLDGSAVMNSSSDYLPSYLLALRHPLLTYVRQHLSSTPLASLGVVVMRDGICRRLSPCTTNGSEIAAVLERDYFLYGGSGVMSLENGLRMALSELVDLKKVVSAPSSSASSKKKVKASKTEVGGDSDGGVSQRKGSARNASRHAIRLRVLLVSASVTMIDPTDVFAVVRTLASFQVGVDVISFPGTVHVFEECARITDGALLSPLNYSHLLRLVHQLAVGDAEIRQLYHHRRGGGGGDDMEGGSSYMIPIGFPVYLSRTVRRKRTGGSSGGSSRIKEEGGEKGQEKRRRRLEDASSDTRSGAGGREERKKKEEEEEQVEEEEDVEEFYLACPQCHLIQTAVPSTCSLCKLLLCSVPSLYDTFVTHNHLVPAAHPNAAAASTSSAIDRVDHDSAAARTGTKMTGQASAASSSSLPQHDGCCDLCQRTLKHSDTAWQCSACGGWRCADCHTVVREQVGLCPLCVSLSVMEE